MRISKYAEFISAWMVSWPITVPLYSGSMSTRIDAAKNSGKIGIIIGVQNSEHFRTPDDVDYFYMLGQRISLLTYNSRNLIGNGKHGTAR